MVHYYIEAHNENEKNCWFSEIHSPEDMENFENWLEGLWEEEFTVVYVDKAVNINGYWERPEVFDPEAYRPEVK